jgi:hypothetical protein
MRPLVETLRQKAFEWQSEADAGLLHMRASYQRMADAYLMMAAMEPISMADATAGSPPA